MARTKAETIMENTDGNHCVTEIMEADGVYTVMFDGKPINVKRCTIPGQNKYLRTSFPAPGYARSMAKRLNEMFNTSGFKVFRMVKEVDYK